MFRSLRLIMLLQKLGWKPVVFEEVFDRKTFFAAAMWRGNVDITVTVLKRVYLVKICHMGDTQNHTYRELGGVRELLKGMQILR